ncbi:Unconventional myosin-XIX [Collichthys lucidus]|uniref:Unconventional myosin-XIX n=1 Tax=Collichthys lucidus TaxID=240159 RepID=A0A4U5V6R2_COLLU|nr:Unconventional myosin-XIX [Collichthys lucidus]
MSSAVNRRTVGAGYRHEGATKVHRPPPTLNDSLDGEVRAFLTDEDQLHTYDDLTKVNPVTPTTVLKCLQARYSVKVFYTHAGCTLVALNPFQPIPHLYSLEVMKEYHCAPQPQEFKPHIYIVAEEAYRNVKGQVEPVNQSLVVSGESGAGKTWTSRCLMKYYATVAASSSVVKSQDTVERIERRVLDSNPIMEAFGKITDCRRLVNVTLTIAIFSHQLTLSPLCRKRLHTTEQQQQPLWKIHPASARQILAGILQLGNVNFSSSSDESQPCNLDEQSKDFLQRAAELLCVPAEELQTCLRVKMLKAGKQNVHKPCPQTECSMRRDCLAKVIYAGLFEWLVTFINNSICADKSMWCNFIGVLDVYGFECFNINNLEQLCINYANEKLQQHFVAHYLQAQQESRLNRASDAKTFRVRLEKELCDNANISWDKFSKLPHFTVAHYAGKVNYQIQGMVAKNKDPVPPELINLLQKSDNLLLHQIFTNKEDENLTTKGLSKVTVVSKFKNSLESLMKILHSTTPHYTRCIKPNPECKPLTFKKEEVIVQLEACGIVETIHISAAGFPIRIPFKDFVQRYALITKYSNVKSGSHRVDVKAASNNVLRQEVEKLLRVTLQRRKAFDLSHNLGSEKQNSWVHCGKTKVFLTQLMLDLLEDQRKKTLTQCAFTIQCCWLRYQRRRRHARQQSATLIQAAVRSWLVRRKVRRWNRAAAVIQSAWREWRAVLKSLAETELDDAKDLVMESVPELNPVIRERGSVQLSSIPEPVTVRGWPMGLALATAPSITLSMTATGFQKMMSVMASLNLPSRRGGYKVETNQYTQELASIRAQPRGSVKLHYQRSPLLYADRKPVMKSDVKGFNEILLEKTL